MRYALAAVALAAGAAAVPYKRDVVITTDIDVEVVYATVYTTVTAGDAPAPAATTTTTAQAQAPPAAQNNHWGHNHHHDFSSVWTSTTQQAPAPEPTTTTPVYVAPQPTTTHQAPPPPPPATEAAPSSTQAYTPPVVQAPSGYGSVNAPDDYSKKTVFHHNLHRANHSAPDLAWDAGLASTAAKIASSCVYAHDTSVDGGGYGQNIAAGVPADNITAIITDLFYNGEVNYFDGQYGQAQPDMKYFEYWGHFSQIVWADTTHVGCATQDCSAQGLANVGSTVAKYFTVCNYKNPGNYANEYAKNVGASKNKETVWWNAGL